jgi:hypothetical protein
MAHVVRTDREQTTSSLVLRFGSSAAKLIGHPAMTRSRTSRMVCSVRLLLAVTNPARLPWLAAV